MSKPTNEQRLAEWKRELIQQEKERKKKVGHLEVSDCYEDVIL